MKRAWAELERLFLDWYRQGFTYANQLLHDPDLAEELVQESWI
jgi:DNA-directed RNA polymerase specialized sigma24 family protein